MKKLVFAALFAAPLCAAAADAALDHARRINSAVYQREVVFLYLARGHSAGKHRGRKRVPCHQNNTRGVAVKAIDKAGAKMRITCGKIMGKSIGKCVGKMP